MDLSVFWCELSGVLWLIAAVCRRIHSDGSMYYVLWKQEMEVVMFSFWKKTEIL